MTNQNWIVFGAVDWNDDGWQIPHQLCTSAAKDNANVLYVESTGLRIPSIRKDWDRILSRLKNFFLSQSGFSPGATRVTVLTPLVLPFPANKIAARINSYIVEAKIKEWIVASGRYNELVLITFLPTPLIKSLIASLEPKASIYYMADDMVGLCNQKQQLRTTEGLMCKEFSVVATTSHKLQSKALLYREEVALIPAGLDESFLSESTKGAKTATTRKIVGFIGGIGTSDDKIDQDLLVHITRALDEYEFVFIGRQYMDINDQLTTRKNVRFIGHLPHTQMQEKMRQFSVGIIPYRVNAYTESVHPCKVYEYLALGIPVVSTPLPEIERINQIAGGIVSIAYNYDDFAQKLRRELSADDATILCKRRIDFAHANTWGSRYVQLKRLIERAITTKELAQTESSETFSVNQLPIRLASKIESSKRRHALLASFFLIGVTVAYSPLVPLMEYILKVKDRPTSVETIVALVGDGEGDYFNKSTDKRADELLRVIKTLKPKDIIISSTRTPKQVLMLGDYLQTRGIGKASLSILPVKAATTASHLKQIAQTTVVRKSKSIYLISGPLHERRAVMALKRNLSSSKIHIYANGVDRLKYTEPSLSERPKAIIILLYEVLALAKDAISNW